MPLDGVDPNDPRPVDRRQFVFATGLSAGSSKQDYVLIFGNKTSAGSEATNVIRTPILDDADCIARFGRRSEIYWLFRKYAAIDQSATIYAIAVPEGGGATAASCTFTFATNASAVTSVKIQFLGETLHVSVAKDDTPTVVALAVSNAINAAADGSWPVTASPAAGVVTVTAANLGPRGDHLIGDGADAAGKGMRVTFTVSAGMTSTKSAITAGATDDDFTLAIAQMKAGEYTVQISPKHQNTAAAAGQGSATAISATDNGIGENMAGIVEQSGANFGKFQQLFLGFVGTQAAATTAAITSSLNSPYAFLFHQEDSDYTPGMIAAEHAAIARRKLTAYPAANLNEYPKDSGDVYTIPAFYNADDIPTDTEWKADLNNGICAIHQRKTGTFLSRFVTTRSLNAQGNNDYRTREGHIPYAVEFFWRTALARWQSEKQPNVANDAPAGGKPPLLTSTPSQLKNLLRGVMDDLAGGDSGSERPLGQYPGPILQFDKLTTMKNSIVVTKIAGGLEASCDVLVIEHLIQSNTKLNQAGAGY